MPLRKFKTEVEIRQKFGLTRQKLDELRLSEGFPYINLAKGVNIYHTDSVIAWLLKHQKNTPETNTKGPF